MVVKAANPTISVNGVTAKEKRSTRSQIIEALGIVVDVVIFIINALYIFAESFVLLFVPSKRKSVKGEIVLITGAGHGIGKELALQYAAAGAIVVAWDINEKNNEETVKQISYLGYPKAHAYTCNVANREEVIRVAKKVEKEVGDITILINNAGIMPCHSLLDHSEEEIRKMFDINVFAHFWIIQTFLPTMLKNNYGHIVAISSCAGLMGMNNITPYCASKYAVRGMMEGLLFELRTIPSCRVKTTTIYPYMVDTGLCRKPYMRFKSMFELLKPDFVAKSVIDCQRREVIEASVPEYILNLGNWTRLLPFKYALLLNDFVQVGLHSDL